MSTSLLYHAFGIRGYRYVRSEYVDGGVVFRIRQDREQLSCSGCGNSPVVVMVMRIPVGREACRHRRGFRGR